MLAKLIAEVSGSAISGLAKVKISGWAVSELTKKGSGLAISGLGKNERMPACDIYDVSDFLWCVQEHYCPGNMDTIDTVTTIFHVRTATAVSHDRCSRTLTKFSWMAKIFGQEVEISSSSIQSCESSAQKENSLNLVRVSIWKRTTRIAGVFLWKVTVRILRDYPIGREEFKSGVMIPLKEYRWNLARLSFKNTVWIWTEYPLKILFESY
jgi:hypothetical protein